MVLRKFAQNNFQGISEVWENGDIQILEKCLLYSSPITLQFLDFIPRIVLDLFFRYVTLKNFYGGEVLLYICT